MILSIPDTHCYDGDNKRRFHWLGKMIVAEQPETIVIGGDWWDMNSVNRFDKLGSMSKEGGRIKLDIQAGSSSMDIVFGYIREHNKKQKELNKKRYVPRVIFLEGNHEARLAKFIEDNPVVAGFVEDIETILERTKVEFVPYGEIIEIDKILFTHILFNGGRPISGRVNTCGDAIKLVDKSVVFYHTHRFEFKQFKRQGSNILITALNAGCFIDDPLPEYIRVSNPNW